MGRGMGRSVGVLVWGRMETTSFEVYIVGSLSCAIARYCSLQPAASDEYATILDPIIV